MLDITAEQHAKVFDKFANVTSFESCCDMLGEHLVQIGELIGFTTSQAEDFPFLVLNTLVSNVDQFGLSTEVVDYLMQAINEGF